MCFQHQIQMALIGAIEELEGRVPQDEELEILARYVPITNDLGILTWKACPLFAVSRSREAIINFESSKPVFHTNR